MLQRADAAAAHCVSCAAARHAAHNPLRRVLALRERVAHAAQEALRWGAAASKCNQVVALRALRGVVNSFGAHATELVQPLGGEVDGGRWSRGGGGVHGRRSVREGRDAQRGHACQSRCRLIGDGVGERADPSVPLSTRCRAHVVAEVWLQERDGKLCIAHLGDAGGRRDGGRVAQLLAVVAALRAVRAQSESTRVPEEAQGQPLGLELAV